MAELTPEELAYFATNRRQVDDAFNLGVGQNQFEQSALGNERTRQLAQLIAQLDQMREGISGQFAGGGTLNSGLYQRALSQFQEGRTRQVGELEGSFADRLGALVLAKQQLEQTRASALGDIDQEEAARKAAIAASIQAALGGPGDIGSIGGGAPSYAPRSPRAPSYTPRAPRAPAPTKPKAAPQTSLREQRGSRPTSGRY